MKFIFTHWRALSALTYLVICVFDFIIFPSYIGLNRVGIEQLSLFISDLDVTTQAKLMDIAYRSHSPFTLQGSGLFHISFGALLTGAAVTGQQKSSTKID